MTEPTYYGGHLEILAVADILEDVPSTGVVALGIHVLSERTVQNADPAGTPLPFSDGEGDWPWWRMFTVSSYPAVYLGTNVFDENLRTVRFHDVLRSRRRVTEDDEVALVAELVSGPVTSSGQVCIQVFSRLLMRQK